MTYANGDRYTGEFDLNGMKESSDATYTWYPLSSLAYNILGRMERATRVILRKIRCTAMVL